MRMISIEPTPSPNSMKINLDQTLSKGEKRTYDKRNAGAAPEPIRQLLAIEGVTSVFHTADFLAVDRNPKADWQTILSRVEQVLGGGAAGGDGGAGAGGGAGV
uniref:NifU N-terminal domain-containing protein n=1 Tax=Paenibacillus koleovorans TaxID=121608 RepID=UPI001581064E